MTYVKKNVNVICLPTKHLKARKLVKTCSYAPGLIGIWKCWFLRRGKTGVETSIRYDHNQDPAVFKVIKINYNDKTAKKKRQASWFSRYFGQSSRPSLGETRRKTSRSKDENQQQT